MRADEAGHSPSHLPPPDPEALAHSRALGAVIAAEIAAAGGFVGFDRFMELALYAPGLGYYSAGARKLGAEGDFVTAPEISPLFGRAVARQCAQVLDAAGGDLLELGAGSGALAGTLLAELERLGSLPERYLILDVSADLRERQRERLARDCPALLDRVVWLDRLPDQLTGCIVANEVLDALPVQRFRLETEGASELGVALDGDGRFAWHFRPAPAALAARAEALRQQFPLSAGFVSEVNPAAEGLVRSLADHLAHGAALLIDYGFPAREYYHPQRTDGTLMCHYRHRAHTDPFLFPGLQDITAHVDFTAMAEAAHDAGLRVAGFTNQAHFLLGNGLAELVGDLPDELPARLRLSSEIRRLTAPEEMGELFKVLALTRGIRLPLRGFLLRDDRGRL